MTQKTKPLIRKAVCTDVGLNYQSFRFLDNDPTKIDSVIIRGRNKTVNDVKVGDTRDLVYVVSPASGLWYVR